MIVPELVDGANKRDINRTCVRIAAHARHTCKHVHTNARIHECTCARAYAPMLTCAHAHRPCSLIRNARTKGKDACTRSHMRGRPHETALGAEHTRMHVQPEPQMHNTTHACSVCGTCLVNDVLRSSMNTCTVVLCAALAHSRARTRIGCARTTCTHHNWTGVCQCSCTQARGHAGRCEWRAPEPMAVAREARQRAAVAMTTAMLRPRSAQCKVGR